MKDNIKIRLEDLPEDISLLDDETIIVVDDYDEMMDDDFWEE